MKLQSLSRSLALFPLVLFLWYPAAVVRADYEPCRHPDNVGLPFCNAHLPMEERAKDLVSRLSQDQKIEQMLNSAKNISHLHIDDYQWWSECLHGVASKCTKDGRCPTSKSFLSLWFPTKTLSLLILITHVSISGYPMPIGLGATFNLPLIKTMASQISSEGRRLFVENQFNMDVKGWRFIGLDFWAPNINIFR